MARWAVFGLGDELVRNMFASHKKKDEECVFRRAVVSGATSGVGEATAKLLAQRGVEVVVGGRNMSKAEEVAKSIRLDGGRATAALVDLSSCASATRSGRELRRRLGADDRGIDLLINNAGSMGESRSTTLSVNLIATCAFALAMLPAIENGVVVNVGSSSHLRAPAIGWDTAFLDDEAKDRDLRAYAQSKLCLLHCSRVFSAAGVNCVDVHPGLVWTTMLRKQLPGSDFIEKHVPPAWRRRIFKDPDDAARTLLTAADLGTTQSPLVPAQRYVVGSKITREHAFGFGGLASAESRDPRGIHHTWRNVVGPRLDAAFLDLKEDDDGFKDSITNTKKRLDQACDLAFPPPPAPSQPPSASCV